jgi:hypothetical protein
LIMTDNQFIDWYVDTLTTKEVIAALKAVEIKVNKKKNAYDMLKSAWKKGPNSLQVAISAYFDEQHKEAREEINSKSRDECHNELNDLVTRFGVKSMVFVLIINSDRFKKEIGYQLVNERGDEIEPAGDDGDDDFEAGNETIQDGNGSEGGILNKLEEIADVFHGGQIIEDVEKIDAAVNSLLKSWQDLKKHRSQRQEYLSEISNYLKQLKEHNTVLEYFLVIPGFPLEVELYKNVVPFDYAEVKGLLNDVYAICQEAGLLLAKEGSNIKTAKQLTCLDEQLKQKYKLLDNILEQSEQPEQSEQSEQPEQPEHPEQPEQKQLEGIEDEGTVDIEPDEGSKSLECQTEGVFVAEDEDKPGDVQKAALSDEDVDSASVEWCEPGDLHIIEDERMPDDIQTEISGAEEEERVPEQLAEPPSDEPKTEKSKLAEPPPEEPKTEELTIDEPQLDEPIPEELHLAELTPDDPSPTTLARAVSEKTYAAEVARVAADAETAATVAVVEPTITIEAKETKAVLSDAERCLWEAIQDGDLATAYWLTREMGAAPEKHKSSLSMENSPAEGGLQPPVPSWLLLSAFLGKEASWSEIEEKDHLYHICMEHSDHLDVLSEQMGISERDLALLLAAAVLRPTLFAPETFAGSWVEKVLSLVNNPADPFSELMQTVLDFYLHGKSLDRKLHWQAVHSIDWRERAKSVSKEVAAWRDEVAAKRIIFGPATETLRTLAGPDSLISDALDVVIKNDFAKHDTVTSTLNRYLDSSKSMSELRLQTTQELYKRKARVPVIDGQSVQQIMRPLYQLRKLFIKWLDSVQIGAIQEQKNDWWYKKTQDFQRTFKNCWDAFEHELTGYPDHEVGIKGKAIRSYALGVFNMLLEELADPLSEQGIEQERDWKQALSRPLLLLRGVPLDEEGHLDIEEPLMTKDSLLQAVSDKRSLKDALHDHLERNDFRLAELVLQELQDSGDHQAAELYQEFEELESRACLMLKDKIDHTRNLIVQATIDHVLTEELRSELEGQLLSIEEQKTRQFYLLFQELDEIAENISNLRGERHESLRDNIKQLCSDLDNRAAISGEQNNLVIAKRHLERSEGALRNGDLALADEFVHYAERAIDTGMEIEVEEESDKVKYVEEFAGVINGLNNYLEAEEHRSPRGLVESLSKGKSEAGLDMKRVPGARYKEIKSGLDAWLNIKRYKKVRKNAGLLGEQLRKLLEYAGFQRPQVEYKDGGSKSFYYKATMYAGKLSPLADFGSQRNGAYDIVLVYSRPHAETIGNILHTYGVFSNCPIVIFTGRMNVVQRREWSNYCRREGLTALLVDELLLYYLASQRESRLPALISCGAAWGYLIPYRSFGVIPPEIFKGRNLMVKELAEPGGSCIVYGGRQFGKTVILHMVQREYDNPEREVSVIYDDIKPLGDPQGHYHPEDLWNRLREMLIRRGILYKGVRHDREHISQKTIEKLNKNKTMQVIVLLDESDNFLAADAKHNFEEVHELRRIMDQTERRFKVVFCGLHSVQRYCSGQNHPFAQMMSRPLVIGPLEPAEARSLITEPMEAIGFSFDGDESRDAVLRILCYTNYHPALIQYFCGELVKLVRKRQQEPPYQVTITDVEGIYRREDVRSFMRERFNWTLDLDIRYQVMVYSMIAKQLHDKDGYRREFTVSDALDCATYWWSRGFAAVSLDEAKALLDELIGLGVLVKRINGKYRLKNGNVVRALGSEQEISERLINMAEQPAPDTVEDARCYRLKLNSEERSPLTVQQSNELTKTCSGVGIVFGSAATGITAVPHTLKFLMGSNFSERCQPLPPDIVTLDQLFRLFSNSISRKQAGSDLFYTFASDIPILDASLVDTICDTSRFLSKYSRRSSIVRWVLIFDAVAIRRWFEESPEDWMEVESQIDAVVYLMRWDQEMIKKYLADRDILATPLVVEKIYEVTGGWPYLLNELWKLMKDPANIQDPRKPADLLKERLADNADGIADGFLAALGVDEVECGLEMVNMFKELGSISRNEIDDGIKTYGNAKLLELSREKVGVSLETLHRLNVLVESEAGLEVESIAAGVIGKR